MKKFIWVLVATLVVGVFTIGERVDAQKTKGKTRAALTKHLMKGLVAANCGAAKKDLEAESINWDDLTLHAALLNEGATF